MSNLDRWLMIPALILPAAASAPAFAVQYLGVEQAQKVLFPGADQFEARPVALSAAQRSAIESASGVRVRTAQVTAWHLRGQTPCAPGHPVNDLLPRSPSTCERRWS